MADIDQLAPQRRLFIGRELTKLHESLLLGCAGKLSAQLRDAHAVRGEFVIVLEGQVQVETAVDRVLLILAEELAPAQAARLAARITGQKKSELYAAACRAKDSTPLTPIAANLRCYSMDQQITLAVELAGQSASWWVSIYRSPACWRKVRAP